MYLSTRNGIGVAGSKRNKQTPKRDKKGGKRWWSRRWDGDKRKTKSSFFRFFFLSFLFIRIYWYFIEIDLCSFRNVSTFYCCRCIFCVWLPLKLTSVCFYFLPTLSSMSVVLCVSTKILLIYFGETNQQIFFSKHHISWLWTQQPAQLHDFQTCRGGIFFLS